MCTQVPVLCQVIRLDTGCWITVAWQSNVDTTLLLVVSCVIDEGSPLFTKACDSPPCSMAELERFLDYSIKAIDHRPRVEPPSLNGGGLVPSLSRGRCQ